MRITRLGKIVTATVVPTIAAATMLTFTSRDDPPSAVNVVSLPSSAVPTPSVGPDGSTPSPSPTPTPTVSPTAAEQRAARQSSTTPAGPATQRPSATPSRSARPTSPSPKPSPSPGSNPVEDLIGAVFP